MCLAKYGACEAIYLCNVVEKIHQDFRPKMRHMFLENKISCSLTVLVCTLFPFSTVSILTVTDSHPFRADPNPAFRD